MELVPRSDGWLAGCVCPSSLARLGRLEFDHTTGGRCLISFVRRAGRLRSRRRRLLRLTVGHGVQAVVVSRLFLHGDDTERWYRLNSWIHCYTMERMNFSYVLCLRTCSVLTEVYHVFGLPLSVLVAWVVGVTGLSTRVSGLEL